MRKKVKALAAALALCLGLSGCSLIKDVDDLYVLPQPPKDYEALQVQLSEVVNAGGEYAAPLTGEMIQTVQLQDLDGDGKQEAIAFFRFQNDEKPMKIYIFHQVGGAYEKLVVIEGTGNAINSVEYVQLDDTPFKELVVSWQLSGQLRSLAAYSIVPGQAEEILRTDYENYRLADLDQDNQQELVVLRTPVEGPPQAELYDFDGVMQLAGTAPLSNGVTSTASGGVRAGYLVDRVPALFVVSAYGEAGNGTVTDVFTYRDGKLRNVTLDPESGESGETVRYYPVSGSDINNDGIMELPQPVPLPDYKITTVAVNFWIIHWRQFDESGQPHPVFTTYHNDRDGWYFILPEEWGDDLALSRSDQPGGAEQAVTFSYWNGSETSEPAPFLTIYKLTGPNRVRRASLGDRFVLFPSQGLEGADEANTIYAAEFKDGWDCGLTEDEVRERFALIKTEWAR